jgi:hypothetical protein
VRLKILRLEIDVAHDSGVLHVCVWGGGVPAEPVVNMFGSIPRTVWHNQINRATFCVDQFNAIRNLQGLKVRGLT